MSKLVVFFLLVVAPALSIFLALLGLETLRQNLLGWFLLLLGIAYPAGGVIFFFIRREPFLKISEGGQTVLEEKGDLSFWAILPGFLAVFFAPPLEWFLLPAVLPRTLPMQIAGLVLILAAVACESGHATYTGPLHGACRGPGEAPACAERTLSHRSAPGLQRFSADGARRGSWLFQLDRSGRHPAAVAPRAWLSYAY